MVCRSLRFALLGLIAALPGLRAEPKQGDVFREYVWTATGRFGQPMWQRVTGPDATMAGAKEHLPNAVNHVDLPDLEGATRVEAQVELLQSHYGTTGQALRLNGGAWIALPAADPARIPGQQSQQDGPPEMWLTMRYPTVEIPLPQVRAGRNVLEFTAKNSAKGLGARWPQSLVYGVTFRVYYDASKPGPKGDVVAPFGVPGRYGTLTLTARPTPAPGRTIRRVDFLAHYRGYGWRGEGIAEEWHYQTFYGQLRRHAGTAGMAPWRVDWDIRDVPSQESPVQVMARIEDDTGLCRMTEALTLEKFKGVPHTQLFTAHDIPHAWQARVGRRSRISCKITLPEDLSGLLSAKLILASWSGDHADAIGINDTLLVRRLGYDHDLSYDELTVPVSALKPGENEFYTTSTTEHHGIEVLWPGPVLVARFARPGTSHAPVPATKAP